MLALMDRSWLAVEVASGLPRARQREVLHVRLPAGVGHGAVPLVRTPLRAGGAWRRCRGHGRSTLSEELGDSYRVAGRGSTTAKNTYRPISC